MTKRGALRATISIGPVWLLGAALLAASTIVSVAESPPRSEAPAMEPGEPKAAHPGRVDETAPRPEPAPRAKTAKPAVEPAKSLPEDDYYAKRAKSRLVEDAADAAKQVSLQAAYPGHNVILCEAGCYGRASRIVQFAPKVATNTETTSTLQPTAAALPGQDAASGTSSPAGTQAPPAAQPPQQDDITCVAGCYGTARAYRSASADAVQAAARAEADALMQSRPEAPVRQSRTEMRKGTTGADANRWMTTSTKAGEPQQRSAARSEGPAKQKKRTALARSQRLRANPSGEWFQQINSDRVSRTR